MRDEENMIQTLASTVFFHVSKEFIDGRSPTTEALWTNANTEKHWHTLKFCVVFNLTMLVYNREIYFIFSTLKYSTKLL
jgi:hypothetical protein